MYNDLEKLALKFLDRALEFNHLDQYLGGSPLYGIKTHDTMGNKVQATGIVMESVYKKYKSNPELELDKKTYEALKKLGKEGRSTEAITNGIDDIMYQLTAEKENRAPFHLNCEELLTEFRNNLYENRNLYSDQSYICTGLQEILEKQDRILWEQHNIKLLTPELEKEIRSVRRVED